MNLQMAITDLQPCEDVKDNKSNILKSTVKGKFLTTEQPLHFSLLTALSVTTK